ncbi:unnamed protein product [Rangifer tarandus platyrhynchus]|uniref:Uncharacterized protein n=2 Tax=Rangifer tarandus platyrhynchus TaxID=3082113 RepID=A0ABN8XXS2_RANTA|nr:unnamed protein product [Rangifer tarandus platyrhynchus]CAI9713235.1 unnamed protein product [Rangifer tarandus platyrhynchus]
MALPCVPLHHPPQERTEATCPDCCPGGFPTGQAAAGASEAENHCGSLKMDALIVKLLQLQRAARLGGWSHLHVVGSGVSPAQIPGGFDQATASLEDMVTLVSDGPVSFSLKPSVLTPKLRAAKDKDQEQSRCSSSPTGQMRSPLHNQGWIEVLKLGKQSEKVSVLSYVVSTRPRHRGDVDQSHSNEEGPRMPCACVVQGRC